jgi:hypothetical protein
MSEEIFEVLGAIAAAFVGTIILDMWLGGGLLSALSPNNFPGFTGAASPASQVATTGSATSGGSVAPSGSGSTTGGIASANV